MSKLKGDPGLPPLFALPAAGSRCALDSRQTTGLRNSYDSLRAHVLKQSSPKNTVVCRLSSAAHRGLVWDARVIHDEIHSLWFRESVRHIRG